MTNSFKPSDIKAKPVATPEVPKVEETVVEKKPFIRKPHLTQRPFRNEQLVSLRDGLDKSYKVKKG